MIKNFEDIKGQLQELAPIINSFKSETVQLRIVELVFRAEPDGVGEADGAEASPPPANRPRKRARKATQEGAAPAKNNGSRKRSSGAGPVPTLNQLLDEDFFKKRQTLSQLIDHCKAKKARTFKPSDFSGPLGRYVRDGQLERQKNAEGQYEYWKP